MAPPLLCYKEEIMMAQKLTKLQLITGTAYTALPVGEVRTHLQGGQKGGTIYGYTDATMAVKIIIAVHAIEYIYADQVDNT